MQLVVRPAAAADIDEAFLWYEDQRPGLGQEFLAAAQAVIDAIAKHFRVYEEVVVVVACMHGRRSPRRWQVRT
jgi:plasmid stabilization system protein ParE